ncbi:helix-turn-helix domain-containing protein [Flavitalea sp. BT771]|uniref:helix-turn-helix domain-containing protein n=1 Tax=Flavitalea sp. BT771 TaxID=3063329 RepID=UPI0026E40B12|nr:helix-turn-helix domain-containing protein [Flavitalea sp. BT771]MDO6430298.1 helix-turn-helix domain-containing protein [Flavitalea sp. BT771]MDV6219562.1 helix-turn-helix domain-containing protein [Flavitalea sp. BT771]
MSKRLLGHTFSLLHVDRVELNEKWNYSNVLSPYFRVYYIDEGEGFVRTAKEEVRLEKGFLYLIPSFTLCHLRCDNFQRQYFLHFFEESAAGISIFEYNRRTIKIPAGPTDIANFDRLLEINPNRGINRSDNPKVYEKNVFYRHYQELNEMVSDASYLETQGIIMQFVARFLSSCEFVSQNPEPIPLKILDAIHYIQINLKVDLTVSALAKRANLHQDYFSSLFLQATGERPLAYVQIKRIERAQYLLATTPLTYEAVAEETGFENLPYFFRIFKKITCLTPGEYKKRNGLVISAR